MTRFRFHDAAPNSLDLAFSRFKKRRQRMRDARRLNDADPDLAKIQQFFVNALRSTGDEDQAKLKTMRYFDLDGLEVDGEDVIAFHVRDAEAIPDDPDGERSSLEAHGAMDFSSGARDHFGGLRAFNRASAKMHGRVKPARDVHPEAARQPTSMERRMLKPHVGGGGPGVATLAAFNHAARRFWGA